MEKYIKADEGFGVLDRLFARIQKADYQATQEMLDKAWEEWRRLGESDNGNRFTIQESSDAFEDPYFLADENGNCHVEADGTVPTFASKEDGEQYIKDHYAPKKREIIVKITGDLTEVSNPIPLHESAQLIKQNLEYRFSNNIIEILDEKDI